MRSCALRIEGANDGAAASRVATHFPRAQPLDNHVQSPLRVRTAETRDIDETDPFLGCRMQRDMPSVTQQRDADAFRAGGDRRRRDGIEARSVRGGEQQTREALRVAETLRGDAAQVGEYVIEPHEPQVARLSVMSGATNVPRIGRATSGSSYRSPRCAVTVKRPLMARPCGIDTIRLMVRTPLRE